MPRRNEGSKQSTTKTVVAPQNWTSLTWDDLGRWAGSRSVSRGEAYQRRGCVDDLALSEDGRLLASVTGTRRYVTSAWLEPGKRRGRTLASSCTCPVGASGCKHAVAAVIALLELLADHKQVPAPDPDDPRWDVLSGEVDQSDYDSAAESFDDSDAGDDDGEDEATHPRLAKRQTNRTKRRSGKRPTRVEWDEKIKAHLQSKNRDELAGQVWSLVERFPELRQEYQERIALSEGDVGRLLTEARRQLRAVTSEMGWRNGWTGEGHTPDYRRLKHKLERLAELGHCDEVVGLGRELISRGMEQVGHSDDEGETAAELADCLDVVFDALAKSNLPAPEKILYVIHAYLEDDYDIIGESAEKLLDAAWSGADWSAVADRLTEQLKSSPPGKGRDEFSRNYARDRISGFLLDALERAGRGEELVSVYEREARSTASYQRLVDHLIEQQKYDDAERWAREGIEETHKKWPGIASSLAKSLCELARRRKQWDIVAAHAALDFFEHPSPQGCKELVAAAERAKCRVAVQGVATQFLESGVSPIQLPARSTAGSKVVIDPAWPLPTPDYLLPLMFCDRSRAAAEPHYDVLLEMAIADKRPDEVLRWYDKITGDQKSGKSGRHRWLAEEVEADRVAKAVAASHPERALDIYRCKLEANLKHTGTSAYEVCADCLRQMRSIYKSVDQEDHWNELIADIRWKYRNRPRFMETLDKLEHKTVVRSRKASRR